MNHQPRQRRQSAGFAIVIALSLMAFVLLLLLSMIALTRVETRSSESQRAQSLARVNALVGMQEAIGQVQKTMGPDQRVSANASILPASTNVGRGQIVGVWSSAPGRTTVNGQSYDRGDHLGWLVSDAPSSTATAAEQSQFIASAVPAIDADHVPLVWAGSLLDVDDNGIPDDLNQAVVVDLNARVIDSADGAAVGRYAWWVGDEGVKGRINLARPEAPEDPNALKHREVVETLSPSVSGPAGWTNSDTSTSFPINIDLDTNASRLLELNDLSLLPNAASDVAQPYFHDLTTWSSGVLADVKNGDLKKDLSLAFEMDDATFRASEFAGNGPNRFGIRGGVKNAVGQVEFAQPVFVLPNSTGKVAYGPVWHLLREYYRLYHKVETPITDPILDAQVFGPGVNHGVYTTARRDRPVAASAHTALRFAGGNITGGGNNDSSSAIARLQNDTNVAQKDIEGDPYRSYDRSSSYSSSDGADDLTSIISASYLPYLMRLVFEIGIQFEGGVSIANGNGGTTNLYRPRRASRQVAVYHNPYNVKIRHKDLYLEFFGAPTNQAILDASNGQTVTALDFLGNTQTYNNNGASVPLEFDRGDNNNYFKVHVEGGVLAPGEMVSYNGLNRFDSAFSQKGSSIPWVLNQELTKDENYLFNSNEHRGNGDPNKFSYLTDGTYDIVARAANLGSSWSRSGNTETAYGNTTIQLFEHYQSENSQFIGGATHDYGRHYYPMTSSIATVLITPGEDYDNTAVKAKGQSFVAISDPSYVNGPSLGNKKYSYSNAFNPANHTNLNAALPIISYDLHLKPTEYSNDSGVNLRYPPFVLTNPLAPVKTNTNLLPLDDRLGTGAGFYGLSPGWGFYASQPQGFLGANFEQWGTSDGTSVPSGGQSRAVVLEIPTAPMLSLGKLQFANISVYDHTPALAISNSLASPYIQRDEVYTVFQNRYDQDRIFPDLSYLMNEALWDSYFFSSLSIPYNSVADDYNEDITRVEDTFDEAFGANSSPLPNPRMQLVLQENENLGDISSKLFTARNPSAQGYLRAAENLVMSGAFNVNSTSPAAWFTILAGAREKSIPSVGLSSDWPTSAGRVPFPRVTQSAGAELNVADARRDEAWNGFRSLSDQELSDLANAIVSEIKERTAISGYPYLSLSDFVNRNLSNDEYGLRGLLQAAIDKSGINGGFHDATSRIDNSSLSNDHANFPQSSNIDAPGIGNATANMSSPGYVLQADILQTIGSIITVRSDTFRIRAYGESSDALGEEVSRAWCEAIVQRRPEPVEPRADSDPQDAVYWSSLDSNGNPTPFGRQFEVVSFRWLGEEEI